MSHTHTQHNTRRDAMSGVIMCPVTDEAKQKHVHGEYCRAFGVDPARVSHVPVDNPVSMDRTNLEYLKQEDYMIAYKANGIRYLLVLTMYDRKPQAILVDRAKSMYATRVFATADHFKKGSVFDGELVHSKGSNTYEFLIFNCLTAKGHRFAERSYRERLEKVNACFTSTIVEYNRRETMASMFILASVPNLHFLRKEVDSVHNMRSFTRSVTPRYGYDGFIFTPVDRPVQPGRQETLLKWKSDNTIDVLIETAYAADGWTPVRVLMEHRGGRLVEVPDQIVFDMQTEQIQDVLHGCYVYHRLFKAPDDPIVYSAIVEASAQYTTGLVMLRYCRTRMDKDAPNNKVTIERTFETIRDNITLEDLFAYARSDARMENYK